MASVYIPVELRRLVRSDAQARCGYCHTPEAYIGMPLDYEHLYPVALGGLTERANLWLACSRCNDFKGDRISGRDPETSEHVPLFNPRFQNWVEHFAWSAAGTSILGQTSIGRATVHTLQLNNDFIIITRQFWVVAGWWPPAEDY